MGKTYRKYKGKTYPDKDGKNRKAARSCLNHGDCPYCRANRQYKNKKRMLAEKEAYNDYYQDDE